MSIHPNAGASPRASKVPTNKQRRAMIWARCEQLLKRMPESWPDWSEEEWCGFVQECMTLQRTFITSSTYRFLQAAERVVSAYDVPMADIDPCHGSAA